MRLTSPLALSMRAITAASITLVTLLGVCSLAVGVGVWVLLVILNYTVGPLPLSAMGPWWPRVISLSVLVAVPALLWLVLQTIRAERRRLLDGTVPVGAVDADDVRAVEPATRRLAVQFGVAAPAVRVLPEATPLAYTTARPDDPFLRSPDSPVVVVSTGLVTSLDADERDAVLAHELAHLVNDDLRLVTWVLVPLVAADQFYEDERHPEGQLAVFGIALALVAQTGIGIFTRGRELAADRAAATATGDPSALASALTRLEGHEWEAPTTDLRRRAKLTNVVSVVPILGPGRSSGGRLSTHPSLDTRLEHLRSLVDP